MARSDRAFAPQSVTLLLEDDIDISRGDMIVKNRDSVRVANELRRGYLLAERTTARYPAQIFG